MRNNDERFRLPEASRTFESTSRGKRTPVRSWKARLSLGLALAAVAASCCAQPPKPLRLRIVGGLAGVNQYVRHEEPFWTRALAGRSGGKYSADIVPFDRAGVPGRDMLTLMQLGVVPFGTALMGQVTIRYPEFGAPDLAGMSPDVASLKRMMNAYRPYLEEVLRDRHGVELLAIYIYPAQVFFCREPLGRLKDIAGRRIRVSSPTQSDFVVGLGGVPVLIQFSELMSSMQAQNTDCAITGKVSGQTLGLHEITRSLYTMPVNWGMAIFAANTRAWEALPLDLRALLRAELPKLEASIWAESERETVDPLACGAGTACNSGVPGAPVETAPSEEDQRRRRDLFERVVLPGWVQRCGPECARMWNQTLAPVIGVKAPVFK
jgi:TRAP-type C4-dicarboxylate transport system substrate-binding protein